MSQLDSLLENYCKCTNCTCADCNCGNSAEVQGLEAKIRARLRAQNSTAFVAALPKGMFRPAAMTASLMLGVASIGLTQPAYSANNGGLMVFSLNSPDLPSTLLGRSH